MAIRTERVEFDGGHGLKLAARLDRPVDEPRAFALFAHCFTCSKDVFDASRREALLRIADRCPVHRTLTSEVRIETSLAEP